MSTTVDLNKKIKILLTFNVASELTNLGFDAAIT
jgi:hypothetical protein